MKVDFSQRASGKTTRMIEWLKNDPNRLMIVLSHRRENELKKEHPELESQIVCWDSYDKVYGQYYNEVGIDDVDIILQGMLRQPLKYISLTKIDNK